MTDALFYKNYFGFREDAEQYVQRIRDFIESIPKQTILYKCKTSKYGKFYARYKNKKSGFMYYITFDVNKERYFIENIISPKTKEYLAIKETKK